jgi:hypothetical protein
VSPVFDFASVRGRWLALVAYAIGMAYVESAAVLYLRTILGGVDPVAQRHTPFNPLPDFVWIEIGREAATMVMLAAVGWLTGRGVAGRLGAFAIGMGVWDIFYYVFLWLFAGWPASPLAPDVLFLIPLPWWGPVLSPVLLALLIVAAGTAALAREAGDGVPRPGLGAWLLVLGGTALCLLAFMADSLLALPRGVEAAYLARGGAFQWAIYGLGLILAALGLLRMLARRTSGRTEDWGLRTEQVDNSVLSTQSSVLPETPPGPSRGRVLLGRLLTGALELLDLGR